MARGEAPEVAVEAIRMGRMTVLQKPDGGVRGIVAGDVMRRLVGRTVAQQIMLAVERFTLRTPCVPTRSWVRASDGFPR